MIGDALADRDPVRAGEQLLERALHGPLDRGDGTAVEGISHHLLEHGLLGDVDRRLDVLQDVAASFASRDGVTSTERTRMSVSSVRRTSSGPSQIAYPPVTAARSTSRRGMRGSIAE